MTTNYVFGETYNVDAVSFALMEREGIGTAFAFDQPFSQRGLAVIPQ